MSGAVCPSCGVAVLPGYVRCPKCKKPLPRRAATSPVEGGTAVQTKQRGPLLAIVGVALLGLALIIYFGLRKPNESHAQPAPAPAETAPAQPAETAAAPEAAEPTAAAPAGPNASNVATNLEKALRKARLWSTVGVVGDHVDVRSGSCSDPQMTALLDGAAPSFKAAGLTRIRCLEQSGRVVTDRDL